MKIKKRYSTHYHEVTGFLDLALEIRQMIYSLHFESTMLDFPGDHNSSTRNKSMRPCSSENLALLRVSKQFHAETQSIWLGLVLFAFDSVRQMLDAFIPLRLKTRGQIRRVHVGADPLKVKCSYVYNRPHSAISLIHGLNLNILSIDYISAIYTHSLRDDVGHLLSNSQGWKTLQIRIPLTSIHYFSYISDDVNKSMDYYSQLSKRGSESSNPNVDAYCEKNRDKDSVYDPNAREHWTVLPDRLSAMRGRGNKLIDNDGIYYDPAVLIVTTRKAKADTEIKPEMGDLQHENHKRCQTLLGREIKAEDVD